MPRAATSVAISASTRPRVNAASARSRWPCDGSPWIASLRTPACASFFASLSAPCLRAAEHDRRARVLDDVGGTLHAVVAWTRPKRCVASVRASVVLGEDVADRVALVAPDEAVDVAVERGREQQGLAVLGRAVEERLHDREEAHVGHAVGFVDDDDLDLVEDDSRCAR